MLDETTPRRAVNSKIRFSTSDKRIDSHITSMCHKNQIKELRLCAVGGKTRHDIRM